MNGGKDIEHLRDWDCDQSRQWSHGAKVHSSGNGGKIPVKKTLVSLYDCQRWWGMAMHNGKNSFDRYCLVSSRRRRNNTSLALVKMWLWEKFWLENLMCSVSPRRYSKSMTGKVMKLGVHTVDIGRLLYMAKFLMRGHPSSRGKLSNYPHRR
jgi:hypothetical protein